VCFLTANVEADPREAGVERLVVGRHATIALSVAEFVRRLGGRKERRRTGVEDLAEVVAGITVGRRRLELIPGPVLNLVVRKLQTRVNGRVTRDQAHVLSSPRHGGPV